MEMSWDQKAFQRPSNHGHKGIFRPQPQSNGLCHLDAGGESGYFAPSRETPSVDSYCLISNPRQAGSKYK